MDEHEERSQEHLRVNDSDPFGAYICAGESRLSTCP